MRIRAAQEEAAELCEQGHRLFSENRVDESVESYSKALDILEPLSEAMDPDVVRRASRHARPSLTPESRLEGAGGNHHRAVP